MPTRYLFDLDHTLMDEDGHLPPAVQKALQAHRGVVTLCSGRHSGQLRAVVEQVGLTAPQAAMNGALLFTQVGSRQEVLVDHPLDLASARAVRELVAARFSALNFTWMDRIAWHVTRRDAAVRFDEDFADQAALVGASLPTGSRPLMILMIIADPATFAAVGQLVRGKFPELTVAAAGDGYLTVTAPGVDKGRAVRDLARLTGMAPEAMVAVGDDENDLPMLAAVGHPGAVANAQPAVLAAASFVLPANTAGGVATLFSEPNNSGANVSPLL